MKMETFWGRWVKARRNAGNSGLGFKKDPLRQEILFILKQRNKKKPFHCGHFTEMWVEERK